MRTRSSLILIALTVSIHSCWSGETVSSPQGTPFIERIEPILSEYCYGCHSGSEAEGGFSFDKLSTSNSPEFDRQHWWTALRKLRAGTMPPVDAPAPSSAQKLVIDDWIKSDIFAIDPAHPDPGHVTLRRLNRNEYRNTISELLGVEYDTRANFPPDDTGHGFDNIGDVLSISPMLLEKYLLAAQEIVQGAVPLVQGVPKQRYLSGEFFKTGEEKWNQIRLPYHDAANLTQTIDAPTTGTYRVQLHLTATENYIEGEFDYNKCRIVFRLDDEAVFDEEFVSQNWVDYQFKFDRNWKAGPHKVSLELIPLTPDQALVRKPAIEFKSVTVVSPNDPDQLDKPPGYDRFFPGGPAPQDALQRSQYARELIERFATRAFRRPVDQPTVDKLVSLTQYQYGDGGKTFEAAVADAMIAILASPRFLFREEVLESREPDESHPSALIDEYSLATRLSYFLWSSMPDDELMRLAGEGKLRENLAVQIDRMMADERSKRFFESFVGQWLQSRDIEDFEVNAYAILQREREVNPNDEAMRERFRSSRRRSSEEMTDEDRKLYEEYRERRKQFEGQVKNAQPSGDVKRAMRRETEMSFEYLIREDKPLQELLDSNYTFLNESLAKYYKIDGVQGRSLQRIELPADSLRGGVLTQSTFLAITSNPDRTSPVKRGQFILENLLGTPMAAPPPNIPPLEESEEGADGRKLTLRESLEIHRDNALCASCHNAMDPLGLALENFNALGHYRDRESTGPIDPKGKLIHGDEFASVKELKQILATKYRVELYTCVTEKLLTYALGRGLDYFDVEAVDRIVNQLEAQDGKAGDLIRAIVESVPFQQSRTEF